MRSLSMKDSGQVGASTAFDLAHSQSHQTLGCTKLSIVQSKSASNSSVEMSFGFLKKPVNDLLYRKVGILCQ